MSLFRNYQFVLVGITYLVGNVSLINKLVKFCLDYSLFKAQTTSITQIVSFLILKHTLCGYKNIISKNYFTILEIMQ